jgi:crotonobetainyl-CoA:carnitine CoA-transferase CaiB-like acyl-CoA transferase
MSQNPNGQLSPYSVLDLTRARSGPTCVRQLADLGASVIQVAAREGEDGDFSRHGFDAQNLHRNKRSITLDLKAPEGIAILKKLAAKSDILVENFRPDVKTRLGIDYETLSAINPRLIYGSISGFGQTGPYRDRPGYDQIAQGLGGLMSITGLPGQGRARRHPRGRPLPPASSWPRASWLPSSSASARGAAVGAHLALLQAMVTMLDFQAARWLIGNEIPPQAGNDHPTGIPTGVFTTKDGHINIAAAGSRCTAALRGARDRGADRRPAPARPGPVEEPCRAECRARPRARGQDERRLGRAAQCQGRALGPDPERSAGLRERADRAPEHGRAGEAPGPRRAPAPGAAVHAVAHTRLGQDPRARRG